MNHCNDCAIDHPSQRQYLCLMMDNEDAWIYYHYEVSEKVDLGMVMKTTKSVCSVHGFRLGHSWEAYLTKVRKFPWSSIYFTSLELTRK